MTSDVDRIVGAIERLRLSVDRLPHAIARALRRQRVEAENGSGLAAFARVVNAEIGNAQWTVAELFAQLDLDESIRETVHAALGGARPSTKSLGSRLANVAGRDFDGLRIERVGARHDVSVWRVQRVKTERGTRKTRS